MSFFHTVRNCATTDEVAGSVRDRSSLIRTDLNQTPRLLASELGHAGRWLPALERPYTYRACAKCGYLLRGNAFRNGVCSRTLAIIGDNSLANAGVEGKFKVVAKSFHLQTLLFDGVHGASSTHISNAIATIFGELLLGTITTAFCQGMAAVTLP
jgi:hypothetical protein